MKNRNLIFSLIASLMFLAQMAHGQTHAIEGTFVGTVNGVSGTATIAKGSTWTPTPATQPATAPVASTPAASDVPAVLTGKPTVDTTGIQAGISLKSGAGVKIVAEGKYENYLFSGLTINLQSGQSAKFTNCRFAGGTYGINAGKNLGNITLDHCEITGQSSDGFIGDGLTITNCHIHDIAGDGGKPQNNCLIQGNYITRIGTSAGAHADGVQLIDSTSVKIVGNFFDIPRNVAGTSSNSAMFLQKNCKDVIFDGNWVRGGNFAIHAYSDAAGGNATIKITNNIFYAGSTQYGFGNVGVGVVWTGNVTDAGKIANKSDK